jgi:uncharacterized protein
MRVVLDTVVFVRALINPYSACGRIVQASRDRFELVVSALVLREILEVLARPELTGKFRNLATLDRQRVLEILSDATAVSIDHIPAVSRDQSDDKFLATALAARADYLVSADNDLLALGQYEGITILDCVAFVTMLEN